MDPLAFASSVGAGVSGPSKSRAGWGSFASTEPSRTNGDGVPAENQRCSWRP